MLGFPEVKFYDTLPALLALAALLHLCSLVYGVAVWRSGSSLDKLWRIFNEREQCVFFCGVGIFASFKLELWITLIVVVIYAITLTVFYKLRQPLLYRGY